MDKGLSVNCKRCKYGWLYRGKKSSDSLVPEYTSCPKCKTLVKINKEKKT